MRSEQGRRLVEEAARLAKTPSARERLEQARSRLAGTGGTAPAPPESAGEARPG